MDGLECPTERQKIKNTNVMKLNQVNNQRVKQWILGLIGVGIFATSPVQGATIIDIVNPGFEDPAMANELNTSFNGVHGNPAGVPGWSSNEASSGGAIHVEQWYPGRTGNNVMYLHGSASQNFYTANFDLGVNLQSFTTYTLTFDVLRWYAWDGVTSITMDNYVTFEAGLYVGADYESRTALTSISGNYYLEDGEGNPLAVSTVTLVYTTGEVAENTSFWIGGNAFGNSADGHRATFDNFQLTTEAVPEPSTIMLAVIGACGVLFLRRRGRGLQHR